MGKTGKMSGKLSLLFAVAATVAASSANARPLPPTDIQLSLSIPGMDSVSLTIPSVSVNSGVRGEIWVS
jgi:hypothetical protein